MRPGILSWCLATSSQTIGYSREDIKILLRNVLGIPRTYKHQTVMRQLLFLLVASASFLIYRRTLLPTVGFWDTGEFQTVLYTLDIAHPTGYPVYLLLGKLFISLFPLGSIAWRVNLFSALCVSLGLYFFAHTLYVLTKQTLLGASGALFVGSNAIVWSLGTRADPHALHFLMVAMWSFVLVKVVVTDRYSLTPLLALITGLSLGNHLLAIFLIPPLAIVVMKAAARKPRIIPLSTAMLVLGVSTYILLPVVATFRPPLTIDYSVATWNGFGRHVLGRDFGPGRHAWVDGSILNACKYYLSVNNQSFPSYLLILSAVGATAGFFFYPLFNGLLFMVYICTLVFSLKYQNAALERYFVTNFLLQVLWLTLIVSASQRFTKRLAESLFLGVGTLLFSGLLCWQAAINFHKHYESNNQSANFRAWEYAQATFNEIANDGVVFSWWSYSTPLWYLQKVEKYRPDIIIVNANKGEWEEKASSYLATRPVYFTEDVDLKNPNLLLERTGSLYQLVPKQK